MAMRKQTVVAALMALGTMVGTAKADLIAYEGFTQGSALGTWGLGGVDLAGLGGGSGFAANWTASVGNWDNVREATDRPVGGSYPLTSTLTASSTSLQYGGINASLTLANRALSSPISLGSGNDYYLSYFVTHFNNGNGLAQVGLTDSTSGNGVLIGYTHGDNYAMNIMGNTVTSASTLAADGTPAFVTASIHTSSDGTNQVTMNVYTGSTPSAIDSPSATFTQTFTSSATLDTLTLNLASGWDAFVHDDPRLADIRIGTTSADVTGVVPEPASLALMGLGALSLLSRRRRHA